MQYTPYGYNGKELRTPTLFVYGRDKSSPVEYQDSEFAYKLGQYLKNYCDAFGYELKDKPLFGDPSALSSTPHGPQSVPNYGS